MKIMAGVAFYKQATTTVVEAAMRAPWFSYRRELAARRPRASKIIKKRVLAWEKPFDICKISLAEPKVSFAKPKISCAKDQVSFAKDQTSFAERKRPFAKPEKPLGKCEKPFDKPDFATPFPEVADEKPPTSVYGNKCLFGRGFHRIGSDWHQFPPVDPIAMDFDWVGLKPLRRDEAENLSQHPGWVAKSPVKFGKGQRDSPRFQVGSQGTPKPATIVQTQKLALSFCRR
jgi:hypothetical protein